MRFIRPLTTVTALALAMACAIAARAADDLPAPPPPSKTLPVASAPASSASRSLPSLDPPKPAPPAACVTRPLTGPGWPRTRAGALTAQLWPNGSNLKIWFNTNDERIVKYILDDFHTYIEPYVNLTVTRVYDPRQAQIRVGFVRSPAPGSGHWSQIGNMALLVPYPQMTANLDLGPESPRDEWTRVGLHEIFGHGIGLQHNISIPDPAHRIDKDAHIRWLMQTQGWSYQQAKAQDDEVSATALHPASRVDYDSYMQYPVPAVADRKGKGIGWINVPSEGDRQSLMAFYPGRTPAPGTTPPPPGTPPPASGPPTIRATHRAGSTWAGTLTLDAQKLVTLKVRVIDVRPAPAPQVVVSAIGSPAPGLKLAMAAGEDGAFSGRFRAGPGLYGVAVWFEAAGTFDFEVQADR